MDFQEHTKPDKLERYSFLWSEARLLVAAVALFLGGTPPVFAIIRIPALSGFIGLLLTLSWIISGAASAYLLYKWYKGKQMLFGGKVPLDTTAFLVSTISGLNLGITGLSGRNIGMSIFSSGFIFIIVGVVYLFSAGYLYKRWKAKGEKLF